MRAGIGITWIDLSFNSDHLDAHLQGAFEERAESRKALNTVPGGRPVQSIEWNVPFAR